MSDELNKLRELAGLKLVEAADLVTGDLSNGYNTYRKVNTDGMFPDGATDSATTVGVGPGAAKQGDNPMQKREASSVSLRESIHANLVNEYRKVKSEK